MYPTHLQSALAFTRPPTYPSFIYSSHTLTYSQSSGIYPALSVHLLMLFLVMVPGIKFRTSCRPGKDHIIFYFLPLPPSPFLFGARLLLLLPGLALNSLQFSQPSNPGSFCLSLLRSCDYRPGYNLCFWKALARLSSDTLQHGDLGRVVPWPSLNFVAVDR